MYNVYCDIYSLSLTYYARERGIYTVQCTVYIYIHCIYYERGTLYSVQTCSSLLKNS